MSIINFFILFPYFFHSFFSKSKKVGLSSTESQQQRSIREKCVGKVRFL